MAPDLDAISVYDGGVVIKGMDENYGGTTHSEKKIQQHRILENNYMKKSEVQESEEVQRKG